METAKAEKKRVRRSAKHSKHGCGTCKIRRIKCDEVRPYCNRCQSFGVTCDGYKTQALPSHPRPLSQAPALLPKLVTGERHKSSNFALMTPFESVMSSNLMRMSRMTPFENDDECKYYSLWCTQTVYEVLPYCQYSLHCSMLYGSCTQASIRHAVIALAALHQAAMAVQHARSASLDHMWLVTTKHHRTAIEHYSKAIQIMRSSVANGNQDIRSTLVTCFITFGFEAFHGNLELAVAQIQTGVALIKEWEENHVLHGAPAPDDEVIETFLCLEVQIISFFDKRPLETHAVARKHYAEKTQHMSRQFTSFWEATKHFYIVKKHIEHFLHVARSLIEKGRGLDEEDEAQRESLYGEARSYQAYHLAELYQWHEAYKPVLAMPDTGSAHDEDNKSRATYLGLHFLHSIIILETVFATDEAIYDEYTTEFSEMISYGIVLKELTAHKSKSTNWTFDLGAILPLHFIATKCRVKSIRNQALDALKRGPRREGIWDNLLVRDMAAWVQTIEEEFIEGDVVPGWARAVDLQSSFDLEHRIVEMKCRQRLGEGLAHHERSTKIAW